MLLVAVLAALLVLTLLGPYLSPGAEADTGGGNVVRQAGYLLICACGVLALRPLARPGRLLALPWPLALALATVVRPGLFNPVEKENGKAAWLMGASFITEGAIPFAAADPLRVIPSIMAGSAVTGALSMGLDVSLRAPHGGIFVLFAVGNVVGFLIALVAGVLVSAALVVALKSMSSADRDLATV